MRACCSKGAMPGTKRSAENSMVPSTLKCACASGSRNSRKVVLKKALYSSWSTCSGMQHTGDGHAPRDATAPIVAPPEKPLPPSSKHKSLHGYVPCPAHNTCVGVCLHSMRATVHGAARGS